MKIGMRSLRFFILLFAASSLLFHPPSDFEAFAEHTDGSFVEKIQEINYTTLLADTALQTTPLELDNNDRFGVSVANIGDLDGDGVNDLAVGAYYDDTNGRNKGAVHIMYMNTDGSVKSTVEINDDTTNGPALSNDNRFGTSINHFIYYVYVSLLGFFLHLKAKNFNKLVMAMLFLCIILEIFHFVIPNRSFQIVDLFGNIFGVTVAYCAVRIYLFFSRS